MKKLFAFCIVIILLISGCTFNVEVLTPGPSESTPIATQEILQTPFATISATAPSLSPTPVPPTTYPIFFNARTASSPDDFNQRSSFPAGTKIVYAIWEYQNMREGLQVRREWYWNGQLWLTREEVWDFEKYGANGTIRDISIYDNETGLNSGAYQLRLYIDNVLQPIGSEISSPVNPWVTFDIGLDEASAGDVSGDSKQLVPGDLGSGMIYGRITDATSSAPTANALVTCEQHSYTSSSPCSGTVMTNTSRTYAFNNVFFHDTDAIKLTVQATGYQSHETLQTSFTVNEWEKDFSLVHTP